MTPGVEHMLLPNSIKPVLKQWYSTSSDHMPLPPDEKFDVLQSQMY